MYRRGDPRWNRTIQHISENIESANESAQVGVWTFAHDYVSPCLSSAAQGFQRCLEPCLPARNDRRRHRGRSRGRPELSFDFYDDWEDDEGDGLLGWGNDVFGSGGGSNYGSVSQPGRSRAMSYGQRSRDPRYSAARRKSAVQPHDGGPDPTIIPSSSYFGFLGRLPFNIGGRGLRYKPSAADLTEHPGQGRRSHDEDTPLIEDSDEEAARDGENKGHRRQRSDTSATGNTTDSLSSRGDIFPSEDELDDAVPLDDEFAVALERRTTGQFDEASSGKTRSGSKRPAGSRMSTRTASSRNTLDSGRRSNDDARMKRSASGPREQMPTLDDFKQEEERLRVEEEQEVAKKRLDAQQLALRRGLVTDQHLQVRVQTRTPSPSSRPSRNLSSSHVATPMSTVQPASSSLIHSPSVHSPMYESTAQEAVPFPTFDPQTAPDSGSFHVDESDISSMAPTPIRPQSIIDEQGDVQPEEEFVPARLPLFTSQPD